MPITFQGRPPFDLPIAESCEAEAVGTHVRLTFHAFDEHNQPIAVRVLLSPGAARGLANRIMPCVRTAEVFRDYRA
jgi:hypothetical protein